MDIERRRNALLGTKHVELEYVPCCFFFLELNNIIRSFSNEDFDFFVLV